MRHKLTFILLAAALLAAPGFSQTVSVDAVLGNDGTGSPAYQHIQAAVNAVLTNPTTPDVINLNTNSPHIQTASIQISVVGGNLTLQGTGGAIARIVSANFTETNVIDGGALVCTATNSTVTFKDFALIPPSAAVVGAGGVVGGDGNGMNGIAITQSSSGSTVTVNNVVVTGNNNANQPTSLDGTVPYVGDVNVTAWSGACVRCNANVGMTYNIQNCVFSQTSDQALNVNQGIGTTTATVGPAVVITGTGAYSYADDSCLDLNPGSLTVQAANPKGIHIFNSSLSGAASALQIQKAGTVLVEKLWIHDFGNGNSNRGIYVLGVGGYNTTIRNCVFERVTGTVIRTAFTTAAYQMAGANWLIEDCTWDGGGQQGYYDGNGYTTAGGSPESITFRRCSVMRQNANGIRPRVFRSVLVQDCWFYQNGKQSGVGANTDYQTDFANGTQCLCDMETLARTDTEATLERCKFEDGGNYGCYLFAFHSTVLNCLAVANGGPGVGAGSRNSRPDVVLIEDSTSAFDADNPTFTGALETRLCVFALRGNDITLRRVYADGSPLNAVFTLSESYRDNELNRLENVTVVNCASTAFRLENATTLLSNCLVFNCLGAGLRKQVNAGDVGKATQEAGPISVDNCLFQMCHDGGVTTDYTISGIVTLTNSIFKDNAARGAELTSCTARVRDCSFINNATDGVRIGLGPGPNAIVGYVDHCSFLNNGRSGIYIGEAGGAQIGYVTKCTIIGSNDQIHVEGIGITAPISISDCILGGGGQNGIYASNFLFTPGITVRYSSLIQQGVYALTSQESDAGNFVTLAPGVIDSDPAFLSVDPDNGADFFAVDSNYFVDKGSGGGNLTGSGRYAGGTVEVLSWRQF